jgi:hypothetical protein
MYRLIFSDAAAFLELLLGRRITVFLPVLVILFGLAALLNTVVRRATRRSAGVNGLGRNNVSRAVYQVNKLMELRFS